MRNRISHIAPFSFLSILLLPLMVMLLLEAAQWYLEETMETRMKGEKLVTLSLPANSIHWEKQGKEFWVKGSLFDIKSYHITNGILEATGYYDDDETSVAHLLYSLTADENNNRHQVFFILQFFTALIVLFSLRYFRGPGAVLTSCHSPFLPQPFALVLVQPPRR